jgi:hypothetical protein
VVIKSIHSIQTPSIVTHLNRDNTVHQSVQLTVPVFRPGHSQANEHAVFWSSPVSEIGTVGSAWVSTRRYKALVAVRYPPSHTAVASLPPYFLAYVPSLLLTRDPGVRL